MKPVHVSALVVLAAAAAAQGPPPSPAEVLARHRTWRGGAAALAALRDVTLDGSLRVLAMSGVLQVRMTRAGLLHQSFDLGAMRGCEGIDARGGWRQNASGQIEDLGADDVERHRGELRRAFGLDLEEAAASAVGRGRERRGEREYDVLAFPGARPVELLFAADGALAFARTGGAQDRVETAFSDYRAVDGVQFPHRVEVTGATSQSIEWTKVRCNAGLAEDDFARPAPPRTGQRLPADGIAVPIDLYLGRYVYVRGTVNGEATDIVIDSGAGITVLDSELAAKLALVGTGAVQAKGAGGEARTVTLAKATIGLGDLELPDLTVAILDLTEVHDRVGRRMPVILGKELFHAFPVTVDYPASTLHVHEPATFAPPPGAVECPVRPVHDGHVMIQLEVEDLGPGWFMVDTGAGDTLALHAPYVARHGLLTRYPRLGDRRIGGVGGALPAKSATAGRVVLAGHEFRAVPVTLATEAKGAFGSSQIDGNLGTELLRRFAVTFDYANRRLLFVPGPERDAPFAKDRSGLVLDRRGDQTVVVAVTPESPAAAAGFAPGDELVAIDGKELRPDSRAGAVQAAFRQPAGTAVRVRDGKGQERTLVLADYF